jgi:hypothetical protein
MSDSLTPLDEMPFASLRLSAWIPQVALARGRSFATPMACPDNGGASVAIYRGRANEKQPAGSVRSSVVSSASVQRQASTVPGSLSPT